MNLVSILDGHPDGDVALVSRGKPTTYGALRAQVAALRGGLTGLGVGPGDRVAIVASNNRYFVDLYLAVLGIGAVAVPLNPQSPPAELEQELAAVGAVAILVGPAGRASWSLVERAAVPTIQHVIATDGHPFDDAVSLDALLEAEPVPVVDRAADDLAVLIFTSGTAGSPKAAMLSHGNLRANIDQMQRHPGRRVEHADVLFGVLPMFHIFGLNVVLGVGLFAGATIVLVERFDPATALDTIRDRGVTIVAGAPPMWASFATLPDADVSAFAGVRLALTGASKMNVDLARLFHSRFHRQILEGYGLTEASPVVTSSVGREPRYGSIGLPLDGIEVRLVDDDGTDVLTGDTGEIWVRGPNVFLGYWNDPDATARVLTPDGWLRTGDIAVADDDGYLWIVDRAKDLIIVSGFNVYPAEVEDVLTAHPDVAEAAVVGVAHPHTGEAVKAYVVVQPGTSIDEDSLIDYCRTQLARYKCPSKILFVDELPKGLGGKTLRRSLA